MNRRMQYVITGHLQAVGFRYTAYRTAVSYSLIGWVHNEYDDSVKMEVLGEQHNIYTEHFRTNTCLDNAPRRQLDFKTEQPNDIRSIEIWIIYKCIGSAKFGKLTSW